MGSSSTARVQCARLGVAAERSSGAGLAVMVINKISALSKMCHSEAAVEESGR